MGTNEPTGRDLVPGFAAMIRQAIEGRGWSNADLAREAGVSTNTVSAVLREIRAPSLRIASQMVAALGLRVWLHAPAEVVGVAAEAVASPANDPEPAAGPAKKPAGKKRPK